MPTFGLVTKTQIDIILNSNIVVQVSLSSLNNHFDFNNNIMHQHLIYKVKNLCWISFIFIFKTHLKMKRTTHDSLEIF